MFSSIYCYRVPKKNIEAFLLIQKKSADIYKKYGVIDDWTFGPENLLAKYGCRSFSGEVSVGTDEELFFSLSLFKSKEDHDRIMPLVDQDSEIADLYNEISKLIDLSKVIRGEFRKLI